MLPKTLLCLLSAAIVSAQTEQQLSLNVVSSFTPSNLPDPPLFTLPPSNSNLAITVALCSGDSLARFFVSNSSSVNNPGSRGGQNVYEIVIVDGLGSWTGIFSGGGTLAVEDIDVGRTYFEVGVSDNGPIHEVLQDLPLLGDTTSNQALLFSPPFSKPPSPSPLWPNYTLPPANPTLPVPPSSSPNFTLVISPTSSSSLTTLPQTGCMLSSQRSSGLVANRTLWLRDEEGWRSQWLMEALTSATNYTAFVVQDHTKVSGPVYFATKSALFSCPLVHSLSYCPAVAYTVPLPLPPQTPTLNTYDATNLPAAVSTPLLSYLTNFTTTLSTFACGRDWYSPLVGCDDCQREYRKWLCTVTFTRCGEPSPASPDSFTASPAPPDATGLSAAKHTKDSGAEQSPQAVFSALVPQTSANTRNPNLPAIGSGYLMLLPCLERCTAVDRACPSFLGFSCPVVRFNAAASYGVGYVDSVSDDEGLGITGAAQDRWGNVWCNAG